MRKVFLDDLPRKSGFGVNAGKMIIDWTNSKGYKVKFVYEDIEGEIEIIEYNSKDRHLITKYKNRRFNVSAGHFYQGKLGAVIGKFTKEFKVEIGETFKDDKRDLVILDREYRENIKNPDAKGKVLKKNEKWYRYMCNKCGWKEGWVEEYNLLKRDSGCSCCHGLTTVPGINSMWDTDRWMCDLGVCEEDAKKYTKSSRQKIRIICPVCGTESFKIANTIFRDKGISCKVCSDGISFPEKFMHSVLKQLNVDFETQYSPSYLNKRKSDFYLPNYNIVIEVDGELGHKGGKMHSKSRKSLNESVEIDEWKDKEHLKHGVKTIRINCFKSEGEYIKRNVLNSELSEIFDFNRIDWNKCEEFSLRNMVKDVCDYWNDKKEWERTTDVARVFGISTSAVSIYLKKGTKLGFCNYNSKNEMKINGFLAGEMTKRKANKGVRVFKEGKLIGEYSSFNKLAEESEKLFGIKMSVGRIANVYNGIQSYHEGYQFEYID